MSLGIIQIKHAGLLRLLNEIDAKMKNTTPAMKIIGQILRTSIIRNFEAEGRPKKWAPLSKNTLKKRKKTGQILRISGFAGGLLGSINVAAERDRVSVGTNKIYAGVHQFGAKKGSFGKKQVTIPAHRRKIKSRNSKTSSGVAFVSQHTRMMDLPWGTIPARPFMMIQDEDVADMRDALTEYLMPKGFK